MIGQDPGVAGSRNHGNIHALLHGFYARPASRTLLGRTVHNVIQQLSRFKIILFPENISRNPNQVALQLSLVPFLKNIAQLSISIASHRLQENICLSNQLHIRILNSIVYHFYIMTCAVRSDIGTARLALGISRYFFQHRPDLFIRFLLTAGHNGRTAPGPFLTAGNSHAEITDSLFLQRLITPSGILKKGISPVQDNIPFLQKLCQLADYRIHGPSGLDHQHHLSRPRQRLHKLPQIIKRRKIIMRIFLHHRFRYLPAPVIAGYPEPLIRHIKRQAPSHYCKSYHTNIKCSHLFFPFFLCAYYFFYI